MTVKYCEHCKTAKPADDFNRDEGQHDYLAVWCAECEAQHPPRKNHLIADEDEVRLARENADPNTPRGALVRRLRAAKHRAKVDDYPCTVTVDDLLDVYEKQEGKCALSGIELTLSGSRWANMSLDKIVPHLGYVEGNVQLLTLRVNVMKFNSSNQEFMDLVHAIHATSSGGI